MTATIESVLGELTTHRLPCVFNPWTDHDKLDTSRIYAAEDRRIRLAEHFNRTAKYLLIGEAPGYQGCRYSGIPFTSERLLLAGYIPGVNQANRITRRELPWSEPSATIVWNTLHALGIENETVLWNSFPFHPHREEKPHTNRRPTDHELRLTAPVLRMVIDLFQSAKVIAVGKIAGAAIREIAGTEPYAEVRHPANGGASKFKSQLSEIAKVSQ